MRSSLAILICLAAVVHGSTAVAEKQQFEVPLIPNLNAPLMARAFAAMPAACRVHIQKALAGYNFYSGPNNGAWTPEVAAAISRYVDGASGLGYGFASLAGAKGILWHIGFEEMECPMPPYES